MRAGLEGQRRAPGAIAGAEMASERSCGTETELRQPRRVGGAFMRQKAVFASKVPGRMMRKRCWLCHESHECRNVSRFEISEAVRPQADTCANRELRGVEHSAPCIQEALALHLCE